MGLLTIVKPERPIAIIGQAGLARLLTPDPKEAVVTAGNSIALDFGREVTVDSAFMGYHTATDGQQWAVVPVNAANESVAIPALVPTRPLQTQGSGPPYHAFYKSEVPRTSRYWRFQTNGGANNTPYSLGTLALGLSFQARYGHEYGAGRMIQDTGIAERLFGGGFGIDDGVAAGGYQWTFGDLQADEIDRLYSIVKDRRSTRSVLVVEDADQTAGLNERIHWGLFQRLDAYERIDPRNWKWALQVGDWA